MKHLTPKDLQNTKALPEGEIFAVYEDRPLNKSAFVLTPTEFETHSCVAIKIKGQLYSSQWVRQSDPPAKKKDALYQILFIQKAGWYNTGQKRLDDEIKMFHEDVFRCAYCGNETTEVKGPCGCRTSQAR